MGASSSSMSQLSNNEYLKRFSSGEVILPNDPFWNQFLSFSFNPPLNIADSKLLQEQISSVLKNLAVNNLKTGNFVSLIQVFLMRCSELLKDSVNHLHNQNNILLQHSYNALFILQYGAKFFIEHFTEELVNDQFTTIPEGQNFSCGDSIIEDLMDTLVRIVVFIPVSPVTYSLHLTAVTTLLVLLSTQMYRDTTAEHLCFYKIMFKGKSSNLANKLIAHLLENFIDQLPIPDSLLHSNKSNSILYDVTASFASGLLRVVTFGYSGGRQSINNSSFLANQSLILLLVLANHCANQTQGLKNLYREALFSCTDSSDNPTSSSNSGSQQHHLANKAETGVGCQVDFTRLYSTVCQSLDQEYSTLLLYLLMHRNSHFRLFLMLRTDIKRVILPILEILYKSPGENSHHMYMALIVVLMFTEDDQFNKSIHTVMLKHVPWITERPITEISLGSLLVLVLSRTVLFNLQNLRDKYLHTNCLAALANMSSKFENLHSYVSQRLVGLISNLSKRHMRTVQKLRSASVTFQGDNKIEGIEQQLLQDLSVLEEVVRMVLEILNSSLTHCLVANPHLLYTLLYERDSFNTFRTHPNFQDILQNIDIAINFFVSRLERDYKGRQPSEYEVQLMIQTSSAHLSRQSALKNFPELKFKYVEEESPDEFFIPYIWSLVYQRCGLYFAASRITLFNLQTKPELADICPVADAPPTQIKSAEELV